MDSKPHIKTYMAMQSQEPFESSSKKQIPHKTKHKVKEY
jgi:hypothetical protein